MNTEKSELVRRAEDLSERCERTCTVCLTNYLTPAEQYELQHWAEHTPCRILLHGGHPECERKVAFFLPEYIDEETFDPSEYICAVEAKAGFGQPEHRDYMGAILGLGIRREFLGDIWVTVDRAVIFCLPGIKRHLLGSLEKVGRYGVKTAELSLGEIKPPLRETKSRSFTVQSMRFDAVLAGMFSLSRTAAADLIREGLATLNYTQCLRTDAPVKAGDIISLRGKGKGRVAGEGGQSRKGRIFVDTEIFC